MSLIHFPWNTLAWCSLRSEPETRTLYRQWSEDASLRTPLPELSTQGIRGRSIHPSVFTLLWLRVAPRGVNSSTRAPNRVIPCRCGGSQGTEMKEEVYFEVKVHGGKWVRAHNELSTQRCLKSEMRLWGCELWDQKFQEPSSTLICSRKVLEGVRKMLRKGRWQNNHDLVVWLINTYPATKIQSGWSLCFLQAPGTL